MLNCFKYYKRCIHTSYHMLDELGSQWSNPRYMLPMLYGQYHVCWCTGDLRSQGISSHGIDQIRRNIPSLTSVLRVNSLRPRDVYIHHFRSSVSCLLNPWLLASPGHQHLYYLPCDKSDILNFFQVRCAQNAALVNTAQKELTQRPLVTQATTLPPGRGRAYTAPQVPSVRIRHKLQHVS